MPRHVPAQLRGLLLVGTLAGAVAVPCAVFALSGGTQQETLVASRAVVAATPLDDLVDDRPAIRLTVAPPVPARASRARRSAPAPRPTPAVRRVIPRPDVVAPMSGSLATRVLAEARRHEGAPYSYGAAGPNRFDCSGFTVYVFGRFGIHLPHNSAQQSAATSRIPDAEKRPGDLIFTYRGGTIGHVGIYAGGMQMWASVESGDVVRLQSFAGRTYSVGRVG
ncbi:MAG: C40 family peptidase [Frankiaceae bacterium]|nr:C40 family peptidase [Frankiaceae bacterium]